MQRLDIIREALLTIGVPVSRYYAHEQPDKYLVWGEDNQSDSVWADNRMREQAIEGTIDYFTKEEDDPNFTKIQAALNGINISWRFNSFQFEKDTNFLHFEWVWSIWLE